MLQHQAQVTELNEVVLQLFCESACNSLVICMQFLHLHQDYEYNLELLDGRDAELEKYDANFEALKQDLQDRDQLVAQLQSGLAHADSGKSLALDIHACM